MAANCAPPATESAFSRCWSLIPLCAGLLAASMLAACSSSRPAPPYTIGTDSVTVEYVIFIGQITVPKGGIVHFRLVAESGHRNNGGPVLWPTPTSMDESVLASSPVSTCLSRTTCADFQARQVGTTVIVAPAPSGIICGQGGGSGCIGVSANTFTIPVHVIPKGQASVVARAGTN